MTPDRWERINRLYYAALEAPDKERVHFLEQACAGDLELRAEVESLLAAHQQAGGFLGKPAMEEVARQVKTEHHSFVGRQLGPYQIQGLLGAGGMGEVYKAKDTRLDRSVALKVLPRHVPERAGLRERFEREARAIASFSHPHICALYDVGHQEEVDFLVMEYLEGETLNQRLKRGPLPLPDALRMATEIAGALDQAHRHGIVHRDLKPGNIMVTAEGSVKVLDFGLAKLTATSADGLDATRTVGQTTGDGTIVGTAAYMSPEQAEGKKVDARSDIFSFGSVLYEMVTGRMAFQGDSQASILAAILREQPRAPRELGARVPEELEEIITRCLRKEPERRFQHMDDLRVALEEVREKIVSENPAVRPGSSRARRSKLLWTAGIATVLLIAALGVWIGREWLVSDEAPMVPVPLTSYPGNEVQPTFSPDGNQIAFVWDGEHQDNADIYTRMLGIALDKPMRLTTDRASEISPAWSPDGRFIAFVRQEYHEVRRTSVLTIPAVGGPERLVTVLSSPMPIPAGSQRYALNTPFPLLAWTPDSKSLVMIDRDSPQQPTALFLVSLESGAKVRLTSPPEGSLGDSAPAISPDGSSLLFIRVEGSTVLAGSSLYRLPLSAGMMARGEPQRLTTSKTMSMTPLWFPNGREILFSRGTSAVQSLALWRMRAEPGAKERRLASLGENSGWPAISAAKSRLVFARRFSDANVWRLPLQDGAAAGPPEKLIYSMRDDGPAQYSPDGSKIVITSNRTGVFEVWVCDSDGSNAVQVTNMGAGMTGSPRWSPDGKQIVFDSSASGQWDIYAIAPAEGRLRQLTNDRAADAMPSFSRDGRHVYFRSDRSGTVQIWRIPSAGGEPVQVTRNGGMSPVESMDGKFLYYRRGPALWKLPVEGGEETEILKSVWATNYAIAERGIYFVAMPDLNKNTSSILFLGSATGRTTSITTLPGVLGWGLSVSPDERFLLYTQVDQSGNDLMLVENFR